MGILGSLIGDRILSAATGTKTIHVKAEQLADIIDETFIQPASGQAFLDQVHETIKGSKLFPKELESEDGRYRLYVSMFERGLTEHRTVWVKAYETNKVFEWNGYTLGPIKEAVEGKLAMREMRPFQSQSQDQFSYPVESNVTDAESATDKMAAHAPYVSESAASETVKMGNEFPSSMTRAEAISGKNSSVLPYRIAFAVVASIAVVVAVNVIQSTVDNEQGQPSDNKQEWSSAYNSQGWSGETDADSSDSGGIFDQGSTGGYSDTNNTGYTYTYGWNDDEDDEDNEYDDYNEDDYDDYDVYESDYIFPNSDSRKLTKADLKNMTSEELRLGRNEIYARHGRLFDDEELQEYFDEKSWYVGSIEPSEFVDSLELNDIERQNAKFILKYENS